MPDIAPHLTNILTNIQTDVINSMQEKGRYATGATVAALEVVVDGTNGKLLAPEYIDAIEYGRGPTSPGTPAGDPTVFEQIQKWVAAKGIEDKAAYPITKQIHKQGYPGKPGVLTEPLSDDNVNMRVNDGLQDYAADYQKEIVDLFGILDKI